MRIGGIQKNSLIDYPGKISGVLFAAGCNFECPYCHNPGLVRVDPGACYIPMDEIFRLLEERRAFWDGVVISGGEPALQTGLSDLMAAIRAMGYPVKLDTNGSRPEVVDELIRTGRVDYLAMDVKTAPDRYAPPITREPVTEAVAKSIRIIKTSGVAHEFRTTCVAPFVDEAILLEICRHIEGADLFVLQSCQTATGVLNPDFFREPDRVLTAETLRRFQSLASPLVKACLIR